MSDTIERETLWVTDEEIVQRFGCPQKMGHRNLQALDHDPRSGFPKKQKLWGDRRFWPAVQAYFVHVYGVRFNDRRG